MSAVERGEPLLLGGDVKDGLGARSPGPYNSVRSRLKSPSIRRTRFHAWSASQRARDRERQVRDASRRSASTAWYRVRSGTRSVAVVRARTAARGGRSCPLGAMKAETPVFAARTTASAVLDGPERIHGEMLPRAARTTKPCVVRHVHDQTCATFHELADKLREDSLVTDHHSEWGWRAREDARAGARLELGDELGPAPDESDQSR